MTVEFDGLRLLPYYLNSRRLEAITGSPLPIAAQHSLVRNSDLRVGAMRDASHLANGLLKSGGFPNLVGETSVKDPAGQRILGAIWGVFTFRGIPRALEREREGKPFEAASFSGRIPLGDAEYDLSGQLSNDHLYSQTSSTVLSGKRRMLIAGQFEFRKNKVEVFPFIIGDMVEDHGDLLRASFSQTVRLYPDQIDQFSLMRRQRPTAAAELPSLLQISEDEVKKAFATIIGEPFVPKDWGGEKSDLSTSRITIDGERRTAAFIFKGPSVPGEMHPANMGKRGDQLVRAFEEPVDLIVIQHCNKVANTVVRMAEALCCDLRRPRRYCIIDGADTLQILKAYDKLPTGRRKRTA